MRKSERANLWVTTRGFVPGGTLGGVLEREASRGSISVLCNPFNQDGNIHHDLDSGSSLCKMVLLQPLHAHGTRKGLGLEFTSSLSHACSATCPTLDGPSPCQATEVTEKRGHPVSPIEAGGRPRNA